MYEEPVEPFDDPEVEAQVEADIAAMEAGEGQEG